VSESSFHVLRVYDRLPPQPGGMERHIAELTAAQRRLGIKVTSAFNIGHADGEAIQLLKSHDLYRWRPALLRNLVFYGAILTHRKALSRSSVDVVHAHGGWSAFVFARALARAVGARVVAASVHDFIKRNPGLHRRAMKGCDPVFATGLAEARYLGDVLGRPVHHLPSAPADMFFTAPTAQAEPTDIIVVGNLVPKKRIELVLDCAARRPDLSFAVYGDGPERGRLESFRSQAGLANVSFHGTVPIERIHSAMHCARLFLNVSQFEGSPTAALEAMACGLPVVLTPSNDYSALVQAGENGIVTRGWDADEIIAAIDRCLADEDRRRTMGESARQVANGHRWDAKARLVTEAMRNVLENRTGRG
jgi:glycosyltransferase involved in cell wall biosynthesis